MYVKIFYFLLIPNNVVPLVVLIYSELAQFELGDISFKTKMECNFVRNPFATPQHVKVSTSEDVLHCPFSSALSTELPHGYGSLKTVTGKLIYSGFWYKGKHDLYHLNLLQY